MILYFFMTVTLSAFSAENTQLNFERTVSKKNASLSLVDLLSVSQKSKPTSVTLLSEINFELESQSYFSQVQPYIEHERKNFDNYKFTNTYGFRLKPQFYIFSESENLKRVLRKNLQQMTDELSVKGRAEGYHKVLMVYFLQKRQELNDSMLDMNEKLNNALSYLSQKNRAETKSLLKVKSDKHKLLTEKAKIQQDSMLALRTLNLEPSSQIDFKKMITIEKIEQMMPSLKRVCMELPQGASEASLDLRSKLIESELNLERAKNWETVDNIDLSLKVEKEDVVATVKVTFNVPALSSREASDSLKKIKLANELDEIRSELSRSVLTRSGLQNEIEMLISLNNDLKNEKGTELKNINKSISTISVSDPLLAMELQKNWYDLQVQILENEYQLRMKYIDYLYECQQLKVEDGIDHLVFLPLAPQS